MKKRILAILAALMLSALSVFYPYAEAKAAGLPELIYTALPLTWPLVTKIFQALGIGTAEYFNSLPLVDRESLITGFRGAGAQAALEIWSRIGAKSANDNLDEYIPAVIDDGVLRISQSIFDVASEFAKENGMLGGNETSINTSNSTLTGKIKDNLCTDSSFINMARAYFLTEAQYNATLNSIEPLNDGTRYIQLKIVPDQAIEVWYCEVGEDNIGNRTQWANGYKYGSNGRGYRFTVSSNGNVSSTGYWFSMDYLQNVNDSIIINGNIGYLGNLGITIDNTGGVPIGEKGQTAEQDGAWSLPYDDGAAKPIDNFGDTYPLSIPDYIGQDLLRWRETAQDIDLGLADLADDLDITRPVEGTQTKAQEGTVDEPYEIDVDSPLIPSVPALTVPNFIKERFPFCIPFDLVRLVKRFNSTGTTAPVFDVETPFLGTTLHMHIDFSMFDSLARLVRIGVLALTAIGIMKITVDVIKW